MQLPTCTNTRIVTTDDAHRVFHAAGILHILNPMIHRRLDAEERRFVRPGSVFVWEERSTTSEAAGLGIERWTDGLRWGPSRVRDVRLPVESLIHPLAHTLLPQDVRFFLFYQEKFTKAEGPDILTKQTYSAWVSLPTGQKKWHLTAYFTQATVNAMRTVDDIPCMKGLVVPPGMYRRSRCGKRRKDARRPTLTELPKPDGAEDDEEMDNGYYSSDTPHARPERLPSEDGTGLAPLSYLQSLHHPRRNPADEVALRAFASIN
ncbi:hypothetical protein BU17DRAFT_53901 [Hysterangium stoloniferum]|nr:hypothetical protein BU17DRAFT_53901 [Hysterangium stoloniferum]